jgi:hypothetical protein
MSDPIGASVHFAAPLSLDNVSKLIECARAAVMENWEKHTDQYSLPAPHLEALQLPAAATQVVEEIEAGKDEYESGSRTSSTEHFSFCPVSFWAPYLTFWRYGDGTMGVSVTILSSQPRYERQGDRERSRMESEWEEECQKRGKPWHLILSSVGPEDGELDDEACCAWWDKYYSLSHDTPSVWPQNRQCFLNIIDHLKKALPVESVRLDPPLLEALDTA